jgi:D-tyrosyl-tRNA(Tyr) deacylase
MRIVIQRVSHAEVTVDGEVVGATREGILALVGFGAKDTEESFPPLLEKMVNLRIFSDERGKFQFSLLDRKGELLLVPQFTLYADTSRGRRPGFDSALAPEKARNLFDQMAARAQELPLGKVATGKFGAHMKVSLLNDGPVTILLDSENP